MELYENEELMDEEFEEDEVVMSDSEIEEAVSELLDEAGDDFSEVVEFIELHGDDYSDDLAEYVFRLAVQKGNAAYVEEFAGEIDLNDEGSYSSYIYETDDEDIIDILMSHGAFRSWDDYDDCQFAYESVNGCILAFDSEFQKEVFEAYKEKYSLTDEIIKRLLADEEYTHEPLEEDYRELADDLEAMGVEVEDDNITFKDMVDEDGVATSDLLEELGWDCSFEGDSWKFETLGVYYIR